MKLVYKIPQLTPELIADGWKQCSELSTADVGSLCQLMYTEVDGTLHIDWEHLGMLNVECLDFFGGDNPRKDVFFRQLVPVKPKLN